MDTRRLILYAALALIIYTLWMNWQKDYPAVSAPVSQTAQKDNLVATNNALPIVSDTNAPSLDQEQDQKNTKKETISVKTDVLNVHIDLNQGDLIGAKLLDYPVSVQDKNTPITLFQDEGNQRYVANSSLFTTNNHAIDNVQFNFRSPQTNYILPEDQKSLTVSLEGQSSNGLQVKKEYTFTRGSYQIRVNYIIQNTSDSPWKGYMNTQLLRSSPEEDKSSIFHIGSYTGASYSKPGEHRYQKVPFQNMTKTNLDTRSKGGWIAMQQHYFVSAWIPNATTQNTFYTRALNNDFIIGAVSDPIVVQPGSQIKIGSDLYVGPEVTSVLKEISPGLDLTVDYGWLWFLSSLLFSLMKMIYSVVGNWGWSIVLVTVLIKLVFFRLSATSYKSMAGMRKLQPKLQALKERYGDDKAKMSQATMELYRQEKVNPLGGCLPIVIQIPVFIALYWVLLESVELRQAPFIFWIQDLAAADPYHVLPIIMGITMLIQQKLNPAPPDPMQAKVMMFLPLLFTGLFWNFPAGLVLYWIVNNTLSIIQQWYITRKYSDEKPKKAIASVK